MKRNNIKTRRVILELLHKPDGTLTKYRLSKDTDTNISWVIDIIKILEKKKIVKNTKVTDFNKLIDFYISLDNTTHYEFHVPEAMNYLKKTKKTYALTTYVAENLTSHHLFPSRIDLYIKKDELKAWKDELFKKGLIDKGNLRLIMPEDEYLFKFIKKIDGFNVVSVPMLMVDLKREGGTCLEAYNYLAEKYVQE